MWKLTIGTFFMLLAGLLGGGGAPERLAWKERADLPLPVAGYMAGVSHGDLVIIGGSYWDHGKKYRTNRVQIFDPRKDAWRKGPDLPEPRSDAASATMHDDIYIFGGCAADKVLRDALVLHHGTWMAAPGAELPEPRQYATAIAFAGSIYMLGGMSDDDDYRTASNAFWRWHPGDKGWEVLPPLPGPGRIAHALAEFGGDIYVFGGAKAVGANDVNNLNDVYQFNPASKQWKGLPDLSIANRSWWAIGMGASALVLAGYTGDYANAVYQYTAQHGLRLIGALPHALADTKFFLIHDVIVGTGGEVGPGVRGKWTLQTEVPKSFLAKGNEKQDGAR